MNKIILLSGVLLLVAGSAQAGILSNIFGFGNYNNGYYYPPNYRYTNSSYYRPPRYNTYYNNRYYYNRNPYSYNRYYNNSYPGNYYNYRQPVIYRTNVKRSMIDSSKNEKIVADKMAGIDKLERQMFHQTYEYETPKTRIERLEQKIFGASQSGELKDRLSTLKSAAKNYKAYNQNMYNTYNPNYSNYSADTAYRPPIFTGSSGAGWQNTLWGNFKNQFTGMPTGFTPAMDPAYMDYFEAERAMMGNGQSVDVRTNRGYYTSNTNRGMTTGVTILD